MKSSRIRLPWPKKKDNKRKFFLIQEQQNWKDFKRKRQHRNWKLKEWNKNSSPPKLSRRQRLLLPRKLLQKQILPDWRESMNSQEERLKLSSRCWRSNNKWKLNKLLSSKNKDFLRIRLTLKNKSSFSKLNKHRLLLWHNKKLLSRLRKRRLRRKLSKRNKLLSRKQLLKKQKLRNWRSKNWRKRRLKSKKLLKIRKRRLSSSNLLRSKNLKQKKPKRRKSLTNLTKKWTRNSTNSA